MYDWNLFWCLLSSTKELGASDSGTKKCNEETYMGGGVGEDSPKSLFQARYKLEQNSYHGIKV